MKKILVLLFLLFFFDPQKALAATISEPSNVPTEVQISQSFTFNSQLSGVQSGEIYFVKCRVGVSSSNLTEGQTYNTATRQWLTDGFSTGKWIDMPIVQITDTTQNFSIQCRVKAGISSGDKIVFARACLKQNDTCDSNKSFQSSSGVPFKAIESTPTPTPSSSASTSSSPTSSPTPIPTPKPATPKPTSSFTPTPTPKATTVSVSMVREISSTKSFKDILGTESSQPSIKPTNKPQTVKTLGASEDNFSKILIALGIVVITISLGIYVKSLLRR